MTSPSWVSRPTRRIQPPSERRSASWMASLPGGTGRRLQLEAGPDPLDPGPFAPLLQLLAQGPLGDADGGELVHGVAERHHQPLVPGQPVALVPAQAVDQAQAGILPLAQGAGHEAHQEVRAVLQEGPQHLLAAGRQGQVVVQLLGVQGAQAQPLGEAPAVVLGEAQHRRRHGLHQLVHRFPVHGAGEADAPGGAPGIAPGVQLGQQGAAQHQGLQQAQGRRPRRPGCRPTRSGSVGHGGQPGQGPLPAQGHRVGLHQPAVRAGRPGPGPGSAGPGRADCPGRVRRVRCQSDTEDSP